jgi:hypothetical protein
MTLAVMKETEVIAKRRSCYLIFKRAFSIKINFILDISAMICSFERNMR